MEKTNKRPAKKVIEEVDPAKVEPKVTKHPDPFVSFFGGEIAERAGSGTLTDSDKYEISNVYAKVFKQSVRQKCSNCFTDAYFELHNFYKGNFDTFVDQANCEYSLKAGVVLQIFGEPDKTVTNRNLTNKLAEEHLRVNPICLKWFSRVPEVD